jgi:hypothetical protein
MAADLIRWDEPNIGLAVDGRIALPADAHPRRTRLAWRRRPTIPKGRPT